MTLASEIGSEIRILRDQAVSMRDGTRLYAGAHLPAGPGPFPVLLERTPYSKDNSVEVQIGAPAYFVAAQPWCNGQVGTIGGSYSGATQYRLAPTRLGQSARLAGSGPQLAATKPSLSASIGINPCQIPSNVLN